MSAVGPHNLARLAEEQVERVGDHASLIFEGTWHTTGEIADRSARVAGGLRRIGVGVGDRVIVLMMNTPEVFITYRAVWRAGAVLTPVLFLQSPTEMRHILVDSGATAVVVTPELLPLLTGAAEGLDVKILVVGDAAEAASWGPGTTAYAELETAEPLAVEPRGDDELAALLYTGGTTGRAKGVMLSHDGLWTTGHGLHEVASATDTTRSLLPLPLSHAYGMIVVVSGMHSEKQTVAAVQRWFDARNWLELVQEHRLESSSMVPSMLTMLLAQPTQDYDLSSLVSFGSGGAPLPMALREQAEERFGVTITEGYGCTESSAVISANPVHANRPGSVGLPLPHVEVAILDESGSRLGAGEDGEVCARGAGIMKGYWNEPGLSAETVVDGWLHTGDVGHLDDDGYLYIVDRIKDLIIRGGFNVFPRDVEDVLLTHPAVASAACVGRPDTERGEEVVAVVALREGATVTGPELVEFAKQHLARNKYPREVSIVDAVPLTSVGKTDRKAVRALIARPAS